MANGEEERLEVQLDLERVRLPRAGRELSPRQLPVVHAAQGAHLRPEVDRVRGKRDDSDDLAPQAPRRPREGVRQLPAVPVVGMENGEAPQPQTPDGVGGGAPALHPVRERVPKHPGELRVHAHSRRERREERRLKAVRDSGGGFRRLGQERADEGDDLFLLDQFGREPRRLARGARRASRVPHRELNPQAGAPRQAAPERQPDAPIDALARRGGCAR